MARVLLVANTASSMVWFRLPLIRLLVARGHDPYVLAPEGWGVDRILEAGGRFLPLFQHQGFAVGSAEGKGSYFDPLVDLATVDDVRRACRVVKPAVMLAYTHKLSLLAVPAARTAGVPGVHGMITGLGYANLGGSPKRELIKRAYHASLRAMATLADSVVLLNADNLHQMRVAGLAPASKLFLMDGEGVDVDHFQAPPPTLTPGRPTFLMVGRLVVYKGVPEYAAAARIVKRRFPEARFLLAGSADPNHPDTIPAHDLQAWVDEGLVEPLGQVPDIRPALREATAFVLPSHATEGLPMSIMEAMAMSRPIVTTRAPGNVETVAEGDNGYLVPQRDPEALAEALLRLCEDPERVARMGVASRERATRRFAAQVVNGALVEHLGL